LNRIIRPAVLARNRVFFPIFAGPHDQQRAHQAEYSHGVHNRPFLLLGCPEAGYNPPDTPVLTYVNAQAGGRAGRWRSRASSRPHPPQKKTATLKAAASFIHPVTIRPAS
jgi:hypothetical protein